MNDTLYDLDDVLLVVGFLNLTVNIIILCYLIKLFGVI
jgi:hypothetical protein